MIHGSRLARSLQYDYSEQLERAFCSIEKYEPSRAYDSMIQFALSETQMVDMPQVCLPSRWMRRGRPSMAGWWRGSVYWDRDRRILPQKRPGASDYTGSHTQHLYMQKRMC